ncbi:hypothetical protein [Marinifilum flexuosum]|uniref:Uncharacterized protein n=1 Tax=Marinifilum flexuosum TaxID=1117708 RepID=A0A419X9R6_9BACT|nr:hypothetical protein [Marinifilum flexuosum]RKE04481.1 hypothetical protein BXY64_1506 [Marinifilum flexuosum]
MRFIGVVIILLCMGFGVNAQLSEVEKEIAGDFEQLVQADNDSTKFVICKKIEDSFLRVLPQKESFDYTFSKLNHMGKITSPDLRFRIYNWNCVLSDGSYKYFGILQYKEKSKLKVKLLSDKTDGDMFSRYEPENWPGALYYKIIPFKSKGGASYLLLGWDGNNVSTNKKLIEVLSFEKSGIKFGKPIISWRGKQLNRVIFEYAKQARMSINYQEKEKRLVFDHLSPSKPQFANQFEYYGPDFTHDALQLKKGIWMLQEDVDVRNK